jgi:hypothetical protein
MQIKWEKVTSNDAPFSFISRMDAHRMTSIDELVNSTIFVLIIFLKSL